MSDQHPDSPLVVGQMVGRYRIDGVAGRGGMGLVYRAWDERLERVVAIKVIAPHIAADPTFRERFEFESRAAAQIEHSNVVPVYEFGEHQRAPFIVMRFVDGVDLRERMSRSGRLDPAAAVAIVSQVAAALDTAHARGLVHRDVKPGNVLVTADGHAYLTDFGISKQITKTSGLTATGAVVGTVDYISPEQLMGRPVDARSDVYALGCVLYELLTGRVPFPRDTDAAKIFAHISDPAPPPSTAGLELPPEFDHVLLRAMAKDPAERYASAGELARAAQSAATSPAPDRESHTSVAQQPVQPPAGDDAPGPGGRERRASGRRGRLWLVGAGAALVAVIAVVAILASGGGGGGSRRAANDRSGGAAAGGASGVAGSSPEAVARRWIAAYSAGDFVKGAAYFSLGAIVNGTRFTDRGQFVQFQAAYACAISVRGLSVRGKVVTIAARNVPGPRHACKGYTGSTDVIVMTIEGGRIARFALS